MGYHSDGQLHYTFWIPPRTRSAPSSAVDIAIHTWCDNDLRPKRRQHYSCRFASQKASNRPSKRQPDKVFHGWCCTGRTTTFDQHYRSRLVFCGFRRVDLIRFDTLVDRDEMGLGMVENKCRGTTAMQRIHDQVRDPNNKAFAELYSIPRLHTFC